MDPPQFVQLLSRSVYYLNRFLVLMLERGMFSNPNLMLPGRWGEADVMKHFAKDTFKVKTDAQAVRQNHRLARYNSTVSQSIGSPPLVV